MSHYGQYCPLALAAEIVGERWNLLIIRRILDGCERFNQIHQGVPKISATLLSRKLEMLEKSGLVGKAPAKTGRGHRYTPTPACTELSSITHEIAEWGQRWAREMTASDFDPEFLLFSLHRRLDSSRMPAGRTVIAFRFSAAPKHCNRFWLIHRDGEVEMCLKDPGHPEDIYVQSNLKRFIEAWRGIRDMRAEIRSGEIKVHGPAKLVRAFPAWLMLSAYASTPRIRPGREARLQQNRA